MVKFGIFVQATPARGDYEFLKKIALMCEKWGFNSLWLNDHLIPLPTQEYRGPFLECWNTLSALSTVTKTLRLGTLCTCISYRYPSLVAKMGATLDNISSGRFEFGIGAGWYEREHIMYGIPFPNASVRIQQLREGIQIIQKMWMEENPSYQGRYYRIEEAKNYPKPIQNPHPPILIGTVRAKSGMLNVVAEFADIWNTVQTTLEDYKQKLNLFKGKCLNIGRDPNRIAKSLLCTIYIAENHGESLNKAQKFKIMDPRLHDKEIFRRMRDISIEEYLREWCIEGVPERCIEEIKKYIDAGATYFILALLDMDFSLNLKSLQLFGEQVIPAFINE